MAVAMREHDQSERTTRGQHDEPSRDFSSYRDAEWPRQRVAVGASVTIAWARARCRPLTRGGRCGRGRPGEVAGWIAAARRGGRCAVREEVQCSGERKGGDEG